MLAAYTPLRLKCKSCGTVFELGRAFCALPRCPKCHGRYVVPAQGEKLCPQCGTKIET